MSKDSPQVILLLAGHSQRGFEISSPEAEFTGARDMQSYLRLDNPVLNKHLEDAYALVVGKATKGHVCGVPCTVETSKRGQRYITFSFLLLDCHVVAPAKGKQKASIRLSLKGLKGGN